MDPVTPSKSRADATNEEPVVNSTPASLGSALVGPMLESTQNDHISPWIARDLRDHKTCNFEDLLRALLESCWQRHWGKKAHEKPPTDLLKDCLEAVLPVANGTAKPPTIGRTKMKKALNVSAESIRHHLAAYCECEGDETSRYAPFANAFNTALVFLSDVHVPLLPPPPDLDSEIIFHRNDPTMLINHKGDRRKPDIVLVPFGLVRGKHDVQTWDEAMPYAASWPGDRRRFQWTDILCSLEFKRNESSFAKPPSSYALDKPPKYVKHDTLPDKWQPGRIGAGEKQPEAVDERKREELDAQSGSALNSSVGRNNVPDPNPVSSEATSHSGPTTRSAARRAAQPPMPLPVAPSLPPRDAVSSGKRKSDSVSNHQNKKMKPDAPQLAPLKDTPPMVQAGMYAADRMSASFDVNFTINIILRDDVAWVWWYDREGAIQSQGINFVTNLPHFLVLILAFQRFRPWNWGHNVNLRDREGKAATSLDLPHKDGLLSLTLRLDSPDIVRHFGMVGRATTVIPAISNSLNPRNRDQSLAGIDLVVKISWAERERVSEAKILEEAYTIAEKEVKVKGHLPELIFEFVMEEPECCTATMRQKLGMSDGGCRILRILVFVKLYPITSLVGDDFWQAFWECYECHYCLWRDGVRHRDISVSNLMYAQKQGVIRGVVNDFDLSSLGDSDEPNGTQRTGTVPYMALDLLTNAAVAGKVKHRYRHDAESFIWVLLVICTHYHQKKPVVGPFRAWMLLDHEACKKEKVSFLHDDERATKAQPTASYRQIREPLLLLLSHITAELNRRTIILGRWELRNAGVPFPPEEKERFEKSDEEEYRAWMEAARPDNNFG